VRCARQLRSNHHRPMRRQPGQKSPAAVDIGQRHSEISLCFQSFKTGTGFGGGDHDVRRNARLREIRIRWWRARVRSASARTRLHLGGRLLLSGWTALFLARRLLGPSSVCARPLGGAALLRTPLLQRLLAPVVRTAEAAYRWATPTCANPAEPRRDGAVARW